MTDDLGFFVVFALFMLIVATFGGYGLARLIVFLDHRKDR